MGWAAEYIARLEKQETVTFIAFGHSMEPLIMSGTEVTVEPVQGSDLQLGDIVLCRVQGAEYLHKIVEIDTRDPDHGAKPRFCIGNNKGHINGWTWSFQIFGRLVRA